MNKSIAVLAGDGIGPEIMKEGLKVLDAVAQKFGHAFEYKEGFVGGSAYDIYGHPLPDETKTVCDTADAIYFGAVGGPKWETLPPELTPERGALLPLRERYTLFANLRPAVIFGPLADAASLKSDRLKGGLDILILRELTGGIYFGRNKIKSLLLKEGAVHGDYAVDYMIYSVPEIERIAKVACEAALKRNKRLTSIDKANVLESSKLWRKVVTGYAQQHYPQIQLSHMYVDNAAMQLATNPKQFDVIVTENMFGDILSDLASAITGSIGMLPSASLSETGFGLFEPIHGSAPDIAGQGKANPLAQILSGAMMLKYAFGLRKESDAIERAIMLALEDGFRTGDIASGSTPTDKILSTSGMGNKIVEYL
ncbi:MAG: 3-isopropylmalate dehydrogenase [Candidatus Loosdrechtia sp.]|uniref:3-isopropylmalate dehydrogenase n=1 Tax=Candidatus Loosdrechtia sp. TaxID=3101272 RepID=UPI003A6AF943|nr:MAG: 3-isopropylmalate dehydrogenase [Candidatus Jettenia sp. AMX2]